MSVEYCPSCKMEVVPVKIDFGIGAYEYWGSREIHRDVRVVCPECETETVLDREPVEETEEE